MANTTQTPEKRAMRIPEFCAAYGVGRSKFYELVALRELKPRKSAKQTLIPVSEAERWFATLPHLEPQTPPRQPRREVAATSRTGRYRR